MVNVLDDKRIFDRFSAVFPLRFFGSSQNYGVEGHLQDASAGGACVVTRRRFDAGDLVAIDVCFSDKMLKVSLIGKVAWSHKKGSDFWMFGFEFYKTDFLKISSLYEKCL